ncbi:hypothetical protein QQ056_16095 [Oscillatoria laete-virens NRMC-F 0139]|nr:hypothetical protein [Oscillatoria laete-virens]MDL5055060.1 hypothetical protein [Oscillatoria laete-virens NRMC-F 0139]
MKYDAEENDLLAHENEILAGAKSLSAQDKKRLIEAAKNTLKKDKRINIRMSSRDLAALQRRANTYGMPYQTLITSILHRYLSEDSKRKPLSL